MLIFKYFINFNSYILIKYLTARRVTLERVLYTFHDFY